MTRRPRFGRGGGAGTGADQHAVPDHGRFGGGRAGVDLARADQPRDVHEGSRRAFRWCTAATRCCRTRRCHSGSRAGSGRHRRWPPGSRLQTPGTARMTASRFNSGQPEFLVEESKAQDTSIHRLSGSPRCRCGWPAVVLSPQQTAHPDSIRSSVPEHRGIPVVRWRSSPQDSLRPTSGRSRSYSRIGRLVMKGCLVPHPPECFRCRR